MRRTRASLAGATITPPAALPGRRKSRKPQEDEVPNSQADSEEVSGASQEDSSVAILSSYETASEGDASFSTPLSSPVPASPLKLSQRKSTKFLSARIQSPVLKSAGRRSSKERHLNTSELQHCSAVARPSRRDVGLRTDDDYNGADQPPAELQLLDTVEEARQQGDDIFSVSDDDAPTELSNSQFVIDKASTAVNEDDIAVVVPEESPREQLTKRERGAQLSAKAAARREQLKEREELLARAVLRSHVIFSESEESGEEETVSGDSENDDMTTAGHVTKIATSTNSSTKRFWVDSDDDCELQADLEARFLSVYGVPRLGRKKRRQETAEERDSSEEEEMFSAEQVNCLAPAGQYLASGALEYTQVQDLNEAAPARGRVNVLEFHSNAQIAAIGSNDTTLNIFQVDGIHNAKIQSVQFDRFPIYCGKFIESMQRIVVAGKYSWAFAYDLLAGEIVKISPRNMRKDTLRRLTVSPDGKIMAFVGDAGYTHLVSSRSNECLHSFKVAAGHVSATAWSPDGSQIVLGADDGETYIFDVRTRRCAARFPDHGSVRTHCLDMSDKHIAIGGHSGVVNLYDTTTCLSTSNPKPLKAFKHLLEPATVVRFNPTGSLLLMQSDYGESAVKLAHVATQTVYSNFPPPQMVFKKSTFYSGAFSPNSGFLAMGTNKGMAMCFRLKHFPSY